MDRIVRTLLGLFLVLGILVGSRVAVQRIGFLHRSDIPHAYVADRGQPTIVCLGDSLTAGDGAPPDESYPAWLQHRLDAAHLNYRVINAGISGNRVADGLSRLQRDVLSFHPRIAIVALGSNDPGRTPAGTWAAQLEEIVSRLQAAHVVVILAGLDEPVMGAIYRRTALRHQIPLVWYIAPLIRKPDDWHDIHHPNGAGYRLVAATLWPVLRPFLS